MPVEGFFVAVDTDLGVSQGTTAYYLLIQETGRLGNALSDPLYNQANLG